MKKMTVEEISPLFPPEIIREILLKASVKSLLRCKSVCKDWYSLISDHHFIKSHYTLSNTNNIQNHRLISTHEEENNLINCPLHDVLFHKSVSQGALELENPLQLTQPPLDFFIVGSCNGLMCLFVQLDDDVSHLFIYNPSTRVCNELPFRCRSNRGADYSFGYDASTDDYKIVENHSPDELNIYSLNTGKWKSLGAKSYYYRYKISGIFLNGALHWVVYNISLETERIVSLDLAKETCDEVLQPKYGDGYKKLTLGVLRDWLCVLCKYDGDRADLWVMNVYGVKDSWSKLASFPYVNLTDHWNVEYSYPLFISNDGIVLFQRYYRGMVIYDSKDGSVSRIQDFKFCGACIVVESLVSPFPSPLGLADNHDDDIKEKL